jgi:hypothetical protein
MRRHSGILRKVRKVLLRQSSSEITIELGDEGEGFCGQGVLEVESAILKVHAV